MAEEPIAGAENEAAWWAASQEAVEAAEPAAAAARAAAAVAQVATIVARELDPERVVAGLLDETMALLGAPVALVHLADAPLGELRLIGHRNLPADFVDRLARVPFDGPFLAARAVATRQLQLVEDATLDPVLTATRDLLARTESKSMLAVPLIAFSRLIGVLTYALPKSRRLADEELVAIRTIGQIVAVGIAHATADAAERRLRAQFEAASHAALAISQAFDLRAVLQAIVEQARVVAGAEYSALGIISADPERPFDPWVFVGIGDEQARTIGRFPRPVGLLQAVPGEGRTIRLRDLGRDPRSRGFPPHHPAMTSFLGVPIIFQGRGIGNLYLTNKVGAPEFTEEDQRAVELLAQHAALAVEHARALEQIVCDIGERKEAEEKAEKERERLFEQLEIKQSWLQTVIERSPVGILLIEGVGGELVTANQRAAELLGRRVVGLVGPAPYLGQFCRPDGTPLSRPELASQRALDGQTILMEEQLIRRPDGQKTPVLVNAGPIRDATGQIIGAVIVFEDVTALKELERLREEWAALIAHDLRQPVTAISGYAGLLARLAEQRAADPQEKAKLEHIIASARQLNRMIADLLDIARLETGRLEIERQPVDLPTLARAVVERTADLTKGHPLWIEVKGAIPPVAADPGRLEQVIANLLANAAKYGDPATEVRLAIERRDVEVQVSIANRGPGIPPEELPQLFTRFHRLRRAKEEQVAGLGLGLYISKGLIEAHGGRIWAESTPGQTTTFHFSLPLG